MATDDILDQLDKQIEHRESERLSTLEAIYEMLCDAGLNIGSASRREVLASKLDSEGMTAPGLDRLIGHACAQKCDDWRGLLCSWLNDATAWRTILRDLERTSSAMDRRTGRAMARYNQAGKNHLADHRAQVTKKQAAFYELYHDHRPKEEIARLLDTTPTMVLEMFQEVAAEEGIPERLVKLALRRASKPEEEHPQFTRMQQSEASGTVSRIYGE